MQKLPKPAVQDVSNTVLVSGAWRFWVDEPESWQKWYDKDPNEGLA